MRGKLRCERAQCVGHRPRDTSRAPHSSFAADHTGVVRGVLAQLMWSVFPLEFSTALIANPMKHKNIDRRIEIFQWQKNKNIDEFHHIKIYFL